MEHSLPRAWPFWREGKFSCVGGLRLKLPHGYMMLLESIFGNLLATCNYSGSDLITGFLSSFGTQIVVSPCNNDYHLPGHLQLKVSSPVGYLQKLFILHRGYRRGFWRSLSGIVDSLWRIPTKFTFLRTRLLLKVIDSFCAIEEDLQHLITS